MYVQKQHHHSQLQLLNTCSKDIFISETRLSLSDSKSSFHILDKVNKSTFNVPLVFHGAFYMPSDINLDLFIAYQYTGAWSSICERIHSVNNDCHERNVDARVHADYCIS